MVIGLLGPSTILSARFYALSLSRKRLILHGNWCLRGAGQLETLREGIERPSKRLPKKSMHPIGTYRVCNLWHLVALGPQHVKLQE